MKNRILGKPLALSTLAIFSVVLGSARAQIAAAPATVTTTTTTTTKPAEVPTEEELREREEREKRVTTLDPFKVNDRQDSRYKSGTAITGTKTDTPLIEVPQSIQVITKDMIEDLGAVDITDLYPLMGSVTEFSYDGVSSRGFRQIGQTRYNGIAGNPYNDFGINALTNVEQVEVLKGPVGLLYGDNEPGGLINIVTARPKTVFGGSVSARVGSWDMFGADARVTGPLDAKKRFLYLASASYLNKDSFRANNHVENIDYDFGFTWVIADSTQLNFEIEYIDNKMFGGRLRGVPFLANGFVGDISFNAAEATDFQFLDSTVYNVRFDHVINSNMRINAFYRFFSNTATQQYHEPNNLAADGHTWPREFRSQLRDNDEYSAAFNFIGDFDVLFKHKILAGVEYNFVERIFTTKTIPQAQVKSIDVIHPVYGLSDKSQYNTSLVGIVPNDTDKIRTGYYLQDQMALGDRWHALIGTRYERFEDYRSRPTKDEFRDGVFTYRGGIVYMIRPTIASFISYGMGLKPQTLGSEDQNGPFPPQESYSWEGGFKFEFMNNRLGVTTTVYDITKTNVLERDPTPGVPTGSLAPIGEINSKGFEADITGAITDNWSLTANYAYNDAKISKSVLAATPVGQRFPNAPQNKAGVWSRYNFPDLKLGIGAGAFYVGERPNFAGAGNYPGPAYTIFNLSVYYTFRKVQFTAKVENLFDKVYSKSVFTTDGHFPGTPRNYTFQGIYRF